MRIRHAFLVLSLALPAVAYAWWNQDWAFRKEIVADPAAGGVTLQGPVDRAPMLLRLSPANFAYFADTKPDGGDLRVLAEDDKTPLAFHVERFDPQSEMGFVWVDVPRVAPGAPAKFLLYYGNPDAPPPPESAATFDRDFALVYHFGEPAGTAPRDATANGLHAASSSAEPAAGSLIAGGLRLRESDVVTTPAAPALAFAPERGYTVSVWVRPDALPAGRVALVDVAAGALALGLDGGRPFAAAGGASAVGAEPLVAGQWRHLALTAANGRVAVHVDGVEVAGVPATLVAASGDLVLGGGFVGEVDELQVSGVARSPDFLLLAARTQGIDPAVLSFGTDAQRDDGGGTSYFGTIARNLTVDGWVVIVICAVMLVISLLLMIAKALHLGRVERANARFMKAYDTMRGDPRALAGDGAEFADSTLYALYRAGVHEIDKRVAAQSVGASRVALLGSASIEAIRAALDATATRLQQALQSRMVLLTIAISGGPFLGLLGTVIGVMITFAAIAAVGDVNVNAIAPGVAAALAATVAGLAVAIPCLFGYNWLNTRIKAVHADNRVFLDEFVALAAERYSQE